MGKVLREATLYKETNKITTSGARILTRGKTDKKAQTDLRNKNIDIHAGHFWVANLPDLTKWNEAFLEITVVASKGKKTKIPHSFKLEVDVKDNSFSSNIQGAEIITDAKVIGTGIEFRCTLTEQDKIDKEKFKLVKDFINDNDIAGVAQTLLNTSGLPINPKETISILFNTVELMDQLNDNDRIWLERPKLDLRDTNYPLYEGWYAFVTTPSEGKSKLPSKLYEYGGCLYSKFKSEEDNEPFNTESYFSWQVISS